MSLRIFILEDNRDTLAILKRHLEMHDHSVIGVESMAEAVRRLPTAHAEVLISDILLPDGSGLNLLNRKDVPRPPYCIAISGRGEEEDKRLSRQAGFHRHLVKPLSLQQIDDLLSEVEVDFKRRAA